VPPEYVLDCQNAIVPLGAGRNDNGGFLASGSAVLISRQIALTDKRVYRQAAFAARVPGEGPGKRDPARALPRGRPPPAPLAGAAGGAVSPVVLSPVG